MKDEDHGETNGGLDLTEFVTDEGGIWSLRDLEKVRGWNNIEYGAGLSGKNTPSTGLSMNRAYIPPGGIAKAHIHVDFDVMIYLLKGSVRHEYGPGCRKSVVHSAGDMFYIEPGLPHGIQLLKKPIGCMLSSQDQTPLSGRTSNHTTGTQVSAPLSTGSRTSSLDK